MPGTTNNPAPEDRALIGRKVFFLNPSYSLSTLIATLREQEYEVYALDNYRDAKNILSRNPESICIITIDSQMTPACWGSFASTFSSNKMLENTIVGVFSERYRKDMILPFFDQIELKGGIMVYDDENSMEDIFKATVQMLERYGAKGRRQYVRASCTADRTAMLYWTESNNCMHQMKLLDISAAAVAVRLPATMAGKVQARQVLHMITLVLGLRQYTTDVSILAIKQLPSSTVAIMTFNGPQSPKMAKGIQEYIFSSLQKLLLASINGMHPDQEDYRVMAEQQKLAKGIGNSTEKAAGAEDAAPGSDTPAGENGGTEQQSAEAEAPAGLPDNG